MTTTITVSVLFFIGLLITFLLGVVVGSISVSYRWFKSPRKRDWKTFVNHSGTRVYITGPSGVTHEYHMSTPGDPTTITYSKSFWSYSKSFW